MSSYSEGQTHQLMEALEAAGFTPADVTTLGQSKRLGDIRNFLRGWAEIAVKSILDFVTTVRVPAQPRFAVRDHFKVDTSSGAAVQIGWIGKSFKVWFLGRTEEPVEEADLAVHKLTEWALNEQIRTELGKDREEITLSQFWALLKAQGKGESGPLLTNGYTNIAYIRDANGDLRAVSAVWSGVHHGWVVDALSVGFPLRWDAGRQVVSRK